MPSPSSLILCYHKVGPEAEEGRSLNIEPDRLESHIRFFQRRRFPFLLGRDLVNPWPTQSVCLTFDDAYISAMTYGREVMLRTGVRATYYVVSGCVGDASRWDGEKARPLADESLLRKALSEGFELGNHTASHVHLGEMVEGVDRELSECQAWLSGLGVKGESFCYPYGSLNPAAVQAVGTAGYRVGMALGKRAALPKDDLLQLPRIVVAYSHSLPMLLYKIHVRPRLMKRT